VCTATLWVCEEKLTTTTTTTTKRRSSLRISEVQRHIARSQGTDTAALS